MCTMNSKERLRAVLSRKIPDRVPMVDISYWPATLERWRKEGLPENVHPADYFKMDKIGIVHFDCSLQLPSKVLEETDVFRIYTDEFGATVKAWKDWRISYAPPVRLDYTIKCYDDWLCYKERLVADKSRITDNTRSTYKQCRDAGIFTVVSPIEPTWFFLEHTVGYERGLMAMIDEPKFVEDVLTTCTEFVLNMVKLCFMEGMEFDGLWFFSDLCYKNGMLFSPSIYRDMVLPLHQEIGKFCHEHGMSYILHCDGDVRELIPLLIEAGFDCIQPLEARCGNDVRELKPLYGGQIVFFGNISTDVMSRSKAEIEDEVVSKVLIAKEGGGYIYHSDHSIPPTVSFENYAYVIELVQKYGAYEG